MHEKITDTAKSALYKIKTESLKSIFLFRALHITHLFNFSKYYKTKDKHLNFLNISNGVIRQKYQYQLFQNLYSNCHFVCVCVRFLKYEKNVTYPAICLYTFIFLTGAIRFKTDHSTITHSKKKKRIGFSYFSAIVKILHLFS